MENIRNVRHAWKLDNVNFIAIFVSLYDDDYNLLRVEEYNKI